MLLDLKLTEVQKQLEKEALSLDMPLGGYDPDAPIFTVSGCFEDGIEADAKLCNGEPPFTEVVLFRNGCEVISEASDFALESSPWEFGIGGQDYTVRLS